MRTHALIGMLLVPAAMALPSSADGQRYTALSANLSFGLFDGVRIGLTHRAHYRGYDEYCWEEAWSRRWNRSHLGWDRYGSPSYDRLSFYNDCVNGGLAYAYQRWQRRSIRIFRPYRALSRAVISVVVRDPFWRPRDRYRAYGRSGRAVVTGRRSPRPEPRFRNDPRRSRYAAPRSGRAQRSAPAPGRRGTAARPGERRRPTETLGRRSGPEGRRGAGTTAAQATRRSERPRGGSVRVRQQAPPTRQSGAVRGSGQGDGRGQGARRAKPRAEARGARPSARPGGRGERPARAPAARRPARR